MQTLDMADEVSGSSVAPVSVVHFQHAHQGFLYLLVLILFKNAHVANTGGKVVLRPAMSLQVALRERGGAFRAILQPPLTAWREQKEKAAFSRRVRRGLTRGAYATGVVETFTLIMIHMHFNNCRPGVRQIFGDYWLSLLDPLRGRGRLRGRGGCGGTVLLPEGEGAGWRTVSNNR